MEAHPPTPKSGPARNNTPLHIIIYNVLRKCIVIRADYVDSLHTFASEENLCKFIIIMNTNFNFVYYK